MPSKGQASRWNNGGQRRECLGVSLPPASADLLEAVVGAGAKGAAPQDLMEKLGYTRKVLNSCISRTNELLCEGDTRIRFKGGRWFTVEEAA